MKQNILKSLFISFILLVGVSNVWAGQRTIFLKPNSNWTQSSAWFSVYCFNNGEEWVKMTDNDSDGTYECLIDEKYSDIIFCRMKNNDQNSLNWDNVWNQTSDLKLQSGKDLYTIASGAWSKGSGNWSAFSLKANKTIYLKPNNDWKSDNAHFAVYAFNASENKWYSLNNVDCNGDYYSCTIEKKYHTVIFCRMSSSTNDWSNVWNQTGNIILLNNGKNTDQFNITDWGAGSWSTYSAPTYNITTNTPIGGTISVSPASSVAVNTSVTVTMNPNSGYKFRKGSIKRGNTEKESITTASSTHTICGPTEINAEFVTAGEQVVYLKPTNYWNSDSPTFAVHVWNNDGNATAKDIPMTAVDCNGDYYKAIIPAGYHSMVFYRKNTAGNDVWNKTEDLEIPVNNNNCYTITSTGSGQNTPAAGSWGTFAPTYDVQVNITGQGTITINGREYSTNTTINNVALNNDLNIGAITPANRWACTNATIKIGKEEQKNLIANSTHNICGPTTINLTFEQTSCKITFDLHLPNGVDNESMMIEPQYVAPGEKAVKPSLREINDYIFGGWYKDKNCTQVYDFDALVYQDITIHAKWVLYSQCIFFKNNLNWNNVYVYAFSDEVWHANGNDDPSDDIGVQPKVNRIDFGQMIQIGESDIYYHILNSAQGFCRIAFSEDNMSDYDYFYNSKAIYRSDRFDQLPLYIPLTGQTAVVHNNTEYYNDGIWMKYNSKESGYYWSGKTGDSHALTADLTGIYSFSTTITLTAGTNYQFKISNIGKDADNELIKATAWYGNSGKMDAKNHTGWHFSTINKDYATITPTVSGDYTVIVHLDSGKVMVSLEYPLLVGDYRLAYSDDSTGFHPGHYIKKNSQKAEVLDTVSFFVHHTKNPRIWLQQCTAIDQQGKETWETIKVYSADPIEDNGDHPNNAMLPSKRNSDATLTYGTISCNITETGVFNFILQQANNPNHLVDLAVENTHRYQGDFYIRTDIAGGGWKSFRNASNQMTYSTYADANENFSHYFCEWILKDVNVKFTIANDYSYCISDTLDSDEFISKNGTSVGCLPENANVRFGWNQDDNLITRAYIRGATNVADRFLIVQGQDDNLKNAEGQLLTKGTNGSTRYGLEAHEEIFSDMNNWVYQADVTANTSTLIKLIADYNNKTQYFKGSNEKFTNLLTSSDDTKSFRIRLIYDFKTNHLVVAWLPDNEQNIDEELLLESDLMLIRRNHGRATQIQFDTEKKSLLTGLENAYGVTTFDKDSLTDNSKSQEERLLYWVSFPFDVRLKDVFGFGEYGTHWIMEYYDGASRAANGLWADSDTYWKYITNPDYTLKAGTGYVLCLSTGLLKANHSAFDHNVTEISLYFPSAGPIEEITATPTSTVAPEHICTIERDNRNIYDSNWNLIGVPGYADITGVGVAGSAHTDYNDEINAKCSSFYYAYQPAGNNYIATSNTNNFQSLFAYMVQYAGEIQWSRTPAFNPPAPVAARRAGEMPSEHTLRLELAQGEDKADQAIIKLQEQDATTDFDMNIDMAKIKNSGANIYTLTENTAIMVAGNALPMEKVNIPVGIEVTESGTYTLRMPDGTDGISVTLLDNLTGIHTDMLLGEYTVTLDAGSHLNRFYIAVDPDRTATSVENVGEEAKGDKAKGVEKYLIDGQLFIRTAEGIFDARGQRL